MALRDWLKARLSAKDKAGIRIESDPYINALNQIGGIVSSISKRIDEMDARIQEAFDNLRRQVEETKTQAAASAVIIRNIPNLIREATASAAAESGASVESIVAALNGVATELESAENDLAAAADANTEDDEGTTTVADELGNLPPAEPVAGETSGEASENAASGAAPGDDNGTNRGGDVG